MNRRNLGAGFALVAASVLVTLTVQAAVSADLQATSGAGRAVKAVRVVGADQPFDTKSTTFVDLPGAKTTISVPSGTRALIVAQFSSETSCEPFGQNPGACIVRILLDSRPMQPESGDTFIDDSLDQPAFRSDEGNTVTKFLSGVGPGTHAVKVQVRVSFDTYFVLDDRVLLVQRSKQS